jgi:hypothetical protein
LVYLRGDWVGSITYEQEQEKFGGVDVFEWFCLQSITPDLLNCVEAWMGELSSLDALMLQSTALFRVDMSKSISNFESGEQKTLTVGDDTFD